MIERRNEKWCELASVVFFVSAIYNSSSQKQAPEGAEILKSEPWISNFEILKSQTRPWVSQEALEPCYTQKSEKTAKKADFDVSVFRSWKIAIWPSEWVSKSHFLRFFCLLVCRGLEGTRSERCKVVYNKTRNLLLEVGLDRGFLQGKKVFLAHFWAKNRRFLYNFL